MDPSSPNADHCGNSPTVIQDMRRSPRLPEDGTSSLRSSCQRNSHDAEVTLMIRAFLTQITPLPMPSELQSENLSASGCAARCANDAVHLSHSPSRLRQSTTSVTAEPGIPAHRSFCSLRLHQPKGVELSRDTLLARRWRVEQPCQSMSQATRPTAGDKDSRPLPTDRGTCIRHEFPRSALPALRCESPRMRAPFSGHLSSPTPGDEEGTSP